MKAGEQTLNDWDLMLEASQGGDIEDHVNVLQLYQGKIRQLLAENSQLAEQIERLKLQLNQIDLYKDQALNFKKQLQITQQKLTLYEQGREREMEVRERLNESREKEVQLVFEVQKKNEEIEKLKQKFNEETNKNIKAMEEYSKEEKKNLLLQVEELNEEMRKLSSEIETQQYSFNEEREILEKKIKELEDTEGGLKNKVNELTRKTQTQREELNKKNVLIEDFEATEREFAEQLEKCHSHIEAQDKYIQELREENQFIPGFSQKVKEYTRHIESLSSDLTKEKQKKDKLLKQKGELEIELKKYMRQHSGENSLEFLQNQIHILKEKIEELNTQNQILQEQFNNKLNEQEAIIQEEVKLISDQLRYLLEFIECTFADIRGEKGRIEEPRKPENKVINSYIEKLKKFLIEIKGGIAKSLELMEKENESIRNELIETNCIKEDLLSEINRVKVVLEEQKSAIKENQGENESLLREISKLRNDLNYEKKQTALLSKQNSQHMSEIYEELFGLYAKYEGVDFVTSKVNIKLDKELTKSNIHQLIATIEDITNILNLEIKNLNVKILDMEENRKKMEQDQRNILEETKKLEQEYREEMIELKKDFEERQRQVFL